MLAKVFSVAVNGIEAYPSKWRLACLDSIA